MFFYTFVNEKRLIFTIISHFGYIYTLHSIKKSGNTPLLK